MKVRKRKQTTGLISINQSEQSGKSSIAACNASTGRVKLATIIGSRLSKVHYLEKMKMIRNVMHNLYGRHNAIDYKPEFNFQQSWQSRERENQIGDNYSILKTQNYIYISLHFTLCIFFGLITWFFTVYRLFDIHQFLFGLISIVMLVVIFDGGLKQYFLFEALQAKQISKNTLTIKDYFSLHKWRLVILVYLVGLIMEQAFFSEIKTKYLFSIDLFFVWISYQRFIELYSALKIKILASKYRNEIMIMQLFGSVILFVHVFGVVLYLVAFVEPNSNWTNQIQGFSQSWMSKYIYSLYFACTTALTVGYGDVTPQNLFEIVTILCVQILGLINMGYIVNEIGRILSKMNENQQMLHKNISEAEKITKNYQLPDNIVNKMKNYIINNQIASSQLNVQEEDYFMRRLNDQLRDDINTHNQLRIIKTSMFFLCHWSKKFQRKIATKLIRCIYSPQESITQIYGSQKLFILTKGKLQIQAFLSKNPSSQLTRCLNFVECKEKDDVHFNVYGYSALISGLIINLKAVVRDYSICYKVDKEDIMKAIIQTKNDFEYFHEIKAKIQQSRFKEIFQAPNIANTRQHYLPNPYFIIKKDRMKLKQKNKRKELIRSQRRQKLGIQTDRQTSDQDIQSDSIISDAQKSLKLIKNDNMDKLLTAKERQQKYKASQQIMITNRKYRRKNTNKKLMMNSVDLEKESKTNVIQNFDEQKIYKHFQSKYNLCSVLKKYKVIFQKATQCEPASRSQISKALEQVGGPDLIGRLLTFKKGISLKSI